MFRAYLLPLIRRYFKVVKLFLKHPVFSVEQGIRLSFVKTSEFGGGGNPSNQYHESLTLSPTATHPHNCFSIIFAFSEWEHKHKTGISHSTCLKTHHDSLNGHLEEKMRKVVSSSSKIARLWSLQQNDLSKRRLQFFSPHVITSQKTRLFRNNAVRTAKLTCFWFTYLYCTWDSSFKIGFR
jgi:hypothetical protein